jgi:hypothetical protein
MRFKVRQYWLCLILLLPSLPLSAQSNAERTARLFIRYEHGAAPHRITENILTLKLSISSEARTKVAIRVCSREPMPFALATAGADPFLIADLLVNAYAYLPERVLFLRSEDCLSSENRSKPVTEIWAIPEGASLPPHVEALKSKHARLVSLGKRPANRGVRDYRTALQRLIRDLRANPTSAGVVFGYFLERPSPVLQRRLREVTRILKQSGLPRDRYLVRPVPWNDEASTIPPDSEPAYPSVFVVQVVGTPKPTTKR